MVDESESPAVPPADPGGDERIGYRVAAGFLLAGGWGVLVIANIVLHRLAPTGGLALGPLRLFPTLGPYALAALGFGLFAGAMGIVLLWIAQRTPTGRFVLPGYSY